MALLCFTNKLDCCDTKPNRSGEWYFPNGSRVKTNVEKNTMYRDRGPSVVHLNLRRSSTFIAGVFHCEILNISGKNHSIYVGIYPIDEGSASAQTYIYIYIMQLVINLEYDNAFSRPTNNSRI